MKNYFEKAFAPFPVIVLLYKGWNFSICSAFFSFVYSTS